MPFADTMKTLPFTPRTPQGSGFFPPIFRASQHILFLLACVADENVPVEDGEAVGELQQAMEHWNARAKITTVSTASLDRANILGTAIAEAAGEYTAWTPENRTANLRDLANRIAQFSADLDRELVGLRDSDPGTTL